MKKIILYTLLILPFYSFGQTAHIRLDTNSILIGEQITMRIGITYRVDTGEEINVIFPNITDTLLSDIEVVQKGKIDTSIVDKENPYLFQQTQELTITSFEVGKYKLPPFTFILNKDTILSPNTQFEVRDVLVQENTELAKIKKPMNDPFTIWDWLKVNWLYIVIPIAVLVVMGLIIFLLMKRKPKEKKAPLVPAIPEHLIAFDKLKAIQSEQIWQNGQFKKYHSEVSDVIREYLEKRFKINALEQTTDEIFTALRFKNIQEVNKENLQQILILADLVKFAKEIPIGSENEETMTSAISFVEETKLVEITPPAQSV